MKDEQIFDKFFISSGSGKGYTGAFVFRESGSNLNTWAAQPSNAQASVVGLNESGTLFKVGTAFDVVSYGGIDTPAISTFNSSSKRIDLQKMTESSTDFQMYNNQVFISSRIASDDGDFWSISGVNVIKRGTYSWFEVSGRLDDLFYVKGKNYNFVQTIYPMVYGNGYSLINCFCPILNTYSDKGTNDLDVWLGRYLRVNEQNQGSNGFQVIITTVSNSTSWSEHDLLITNVSQQINVNDSKFGPCFFKRIVFNRTTQQKGNAIFLTWGPEHNSTKKDAKFYLGVINYNFPNDFVTDLFRSSNWSLYINIPENISGNIGNNLWITKDLKLMLCVPKGDYGAGKGLNIVTSSNALFNAKGWAGASYSLNDSSVSEINSALANYHVLEITFNDNNNKMIVLCNNKRGSIGVTLGSGGDIFNSFEIGIQPTHMFCFMKVGNKWKNISYNLVGFTNFWNTYNSLGNQGEGYKPFFSINRNYQTGYDIGYMSPSCSSDTKMYYAKLTFDD